MKTSTQLAIVFAILAFAILKFGWWALLVVGFAAVGYLIGAHLEGSFDLRAAWVALTGNTKTKSD